MYQISVVTLLPDMFLSFKYGVTGRAIERGLVQITCWNPRDWSKRAYRQIDDKPYGGGPGMVMMYEPLHQAITHARTQMPTNCKVVLLSPQGKRVTQADLTNIASNKEPLLFVAGRYEGVDERLIAQDIDEEWSLGDFVLSGGEFAAMAFIDAIVRLLPGCLGHFASAAQDSFANGLLDYPHYTRPAIIDGRQVPAVLLSGNHRDITRWRKKQALGQTWLKRPELLLKLPLSDLDKELLNEFKYEQGDSSK